MLPPADAQPFLIVTGSSAGGIEALSLLVASLPADFDTPVVIAQHLAPGHDSRLVDILRSRTTLRVVAVDDRETLVGGSIYVIPPDHDVEIVDSHAASFIVARKGPKPSIDRLFASAAASYEERLIAIIFSGMGSDGLAGARVVKEHGGIVVVQEPASASFPSMPLSIPPPLVDLVARPEAMGELLVTYMQGVAVPETANDQKLLRTVLVQLRDRTGIDFTQYKTPTIMRRLSRLMVSAGVDSLGAYVSYLQLHPEGFVKLVGAFLIKVTEFFRDAALFEELQDTVLPRLIAEARANGNELRMWSAGTSTGEEAYSLAILCAELLRADAAPPVVRIFATDLDEDAIAFARRGHYTAESVRQLPSDWVDRYFVRVGDDFEVGKVIRNMTVFGQHDLGQRAPFPRIDLCLCRNVLIYFTRELQTRALQLFAFSLRNGGYLVLGKAESTGALDEYFRQVNPSLKIYERQGDRVLIPPTRIRDPELLADARIAADRLAAMPALAAVPRPLEQRLTVSDTYGSFLANSSVGIVVVDRRYDIIGINLAARGMLEIHGVGIGDDLIHAVRGIDPAELRDAIDAAFRNEAPPARDVAIDGASGEVERWLHLAVSADRAVPGGRSEAVAIVMVDVTANVTRLRELEAAVASSDVRVVGLTSQSEELDRRLRALLRANDELSAANNELRAANEQLLISAEEAASSNEEIETLNEEMQATNEELETLNEELQATVEELNTTNDELESRGSELERLAVDRTAELQRVVDDRMALARALEAVAGPLAVLDANGALLYGSERCGGPAAFASLAPHWWLGPAVALGGTRFDVRRESAGTDGATIVFLTPGAAPAVP